MSATVRHGPKCQLRYGLGMVRHPHVSATVRHGPKCQLRYGLGMEEGRIMSFQNDQILFLSIH